MMATVSCRRTSRRLQSARGQSLVETTIATTILLVVLVGLMSAMSMATALTENEGHLSARAAEYAQDKMEQLLALAYSDTTSDTTQIPTSEANGVGMIPGGSQNPDTPVAKYVDYLDSDGKPLLSADAAEPGTDTEARALGQCDDALTSLHSVESGTLDETRHADPMWSSGAQEEGEYVAVVGHRDTFHSLCRRGSDGFAC